MSVLPLIVSMASMMNAREDLMFDYGKFSLIVLTAFRLLHLLMRRSFACMVDYLLI